RTYPEARGGHRVGDERSAGVAGPQGKVRLAEAADRCAVTTLQDCRKSGLQKGKGKVLLTFLSAILQSCNPAMSRSEIGRRHCRVALSLVEDQPVWALLLIHVEALAIVAPHAFARDDLRPADGAPLARLLANLAGLALGPPLDPEHGQVRDDS